MKNDCKRIGANYMLIDFNITKKITVPGMNNGTLTQKL